MAGLAATGALRPGQIVAHTSGAHGLAVLGDVHGMALHPAMTFTGTDGDLDRLPGIAWGVTARDRAFATRLVADLGGVPEWIAEDARPLYHAALAHGANHLVTLVNEAADLLRAAGVEQPGRVLSPLLRAALDNALRLGDAALTGPVSRGDAGTVGEHLRPACRPTRYPRTSPWPGAPRTGPSPPAVCGRGTPRRCSMSLPVPPWGARHDRRRAHPGRARLEPGRRARRDRAW